MPRLPVDQLGGGGKTPDNGTWTYWQWDPATGRWVGTQQTGPKPATFQQEMHIDPATGKATWQSVPVGWTPADPNALGQTPTGYQTNVPMTHSEAIASHYASVGGQDYYVETQAEAAARQSGLQRDANGYYRLVNGQKVYQTGVDPATGQRWHLDPDPTHADPFTGQPGKIFDDEFKTLYGTRDDLVKQQQEAQNQLVALRNQFKASRGDAWVVRENLLVRIRDVENTIESINRALGKDPVPEATNKISGTTETKFEGGVKVDMSFAVWDDAQPDLSFTNPLLSAPLGAHIVARAVVEIGDRKWTPGLLKTPDMVRVKWTIPAEFTTLDGAPLATDEFISGNSVQVMREFLSPASANTNIGRGSDLTFGVKASLYEIVLDPMNIPDVWHKEGNDGYTGYTISLPGDGSVPLDQLAKFMQGLGFVESHNNPTEQQHHSPFAYGEWQITAANWITWSKVVFGRVVAKTPENSEKIAVYRVSKLYLHVANESWRRVCVAWITGPGFVRRNQDCALHSGDKWYYRVRNMFLHSGGLESDQFE